MRRTLRPMAWRLPPALSVLLATACVSTPDVAPADRAGCYYFERDAAADALALPWGVRLLTDSLQGWPAIQQLPGVRQAETLVHYDARAGYPFGYWRPLAADSIEIGYPAGGGLLLRLHADAARLAGTARPVGDVMPAPGAGAARTATAVSLVRASCP
jgi:hypothetical protein